MQAWRGSRQETGIKCNGDIAEVWQGDHQVGLLYGWRIAGGDGRWNGYANKHRFVETFDNGEVEARFLFAGLPLELRGVAHMLDVIADGEMHREEVMLKGTRLWLETGLPVPSE